MGSQRLTLCTGAVVAAALAPTAYAADVQGVILTPASPVPGTDVRLAVRGCPGTTGTAASDAFVADARLVGKDGMLTGDTRVRSTLAPGMYTVTIGCDGRQVKGVVTVGRPTAPAPTGTVPAASTGTASTPSASTAAALTTGTVSTSSAGTTAAPSASTASTLTASTASPRASAPPATTTSSPVAPVHAGGGGTAQASVDAREAGPGTRQAIIGLVLASVAAVVVLARSVRRGHGPE